MVYGLTFLVYALRLGGIAIVLGVFLVLGAWTSILVVRSSTMVATAVAKGAVSGMLIAALIPFVTLVVIAGICSMMTGGYPFAEEEGAGSRTVTYNLTLYGNPPAGKALAIQESGRPLEEETGYFYLPVCGDDPAAAPDEPPEPCPVGESGGGESVSIQGANPDDGSGMVYFRFVMVDAAHPAGTAFYQGEGSELEAVDAWYDFRTGKGGAGREP